MLRHFALMLLCTAAIQAAAEPFGGEPLDGPWHIHAGAPGREPDVGPWQAFLDTWLVTDAADGIHRLRYQAVDADARSALDAWLTAQGDVDPRTLDRGQQMAWWINLYNALTVRLILQHPGIDSIRDIGGWFGPGPWRRTVIRVLETDLTLDDIEHGILRPVFRDPRIHFAVNCASLGCPNLAARAYTAGELDAMLEAGARDYVNHPRGARFDDDGALHLSSIFDWYREDFPRGRQALTNWLADRARPSLAARLRGHDGRIRHDYDWSLNAAR